MEHGGKSALRASRSVGHARRISEITSKFVLNS